MRAKRGAPGLMQSAGEIEAEQRRRQNVATGEAAQSTALLGMAVRGCHPQALELSKESWTRAGHHKVKLWY